MTIKLYYENPYLKETKSNVLEVIEKESKILAVLDKSIFYPEGGGQPADKGFIADAEVIDVFEKEGIIYHSIDKIISLGEAQCVLDFQRRFDHMQQHSGEHMLAATFFKLFETVSQGFHMGEDYCNIDISLKELSDDNINKIEEIVNQHIYSNFPVETFFVSQEESRKLPLRKRVDEEDVRIVRIGEVDSCACCGTHVKNVGEIGLIKIIKREKYKGMTRVYFKCGKRAFEDLSKKQTIVNTLVKNLSTSEENLFTKISSDQDKIKELGREIGNYKKQLASFEGEKLKTEKNGYMIIKAYEDKSFEEVQYVGEYLIEQGALVILSAKKENKLFIINNSEINIDLGKLFKENLKNYGGKGGGNKIRVQATFNTCESMDAFVKEVILVNSSK